MVRLTCTLIFVSLSLSFAASIHLAAEAEPVLQFAAKDLARCLHLLTGRNYDCVVQGEKEAGDLVLANNPSLESQQWQLKTQDGALYIYGADAVGIVYGVYTFLEKYAGCLWLAPDTEIIRPIADWQLPRLDEKQKPAFTRREMYVGYDYMDGVWRLRNKENNRAAYSVNMRVGRPRDCHTFDQYVQVIKDPALFGPSKDGRRSNTLCMSNPEVRRLVLAELLKNIESDRAALAGKPAYMYPLIYDLSQPDGASGSECWCADCRKLAEDEGSYAGPNIDFVNQLARQIKKLYPELLLRTFAYSYTMKPPKNIRADDNVIVQFCDAHLFKPLLPGSANGDDLQTWGRHASQKAIWSYWRTFTGPLYPFVKSRADIAAELRFCRDNGVIHYFAENESPLSRSFAMLQHWLMLKLLENPDHDINALADKFLQGYYGKAAGLMSLYLDYLEQRQEASRAYLDREFFEQVNAWLDEAENMLASDPLSLAHLNWERIVVDRSMYQNLAALQKAGYQADLEKISARFAKNALAQIESWSFNAEQKSKRLLQAKNEAALYAYFPVEIPERFKDCEVLDLQWNQINAGGAEFVKDPDAVCGAAFFNAKLSPRIPFSLGFYNNSSARGDGVSLSMQDIPQDEKFHLYKLGKASIMAPLYIHFDSSWTFRAYLQTLGIIPEEREIWVSMKFAGPHYVKGSSSDNAVLFDRVLLVKDEKPLRHYKPLRPELNLLKNGGFEEHSPNWIPDWGRPSEYHNVDAQVSKPQL